MPTPKRGPRLGGGPAHQRHMMAGQASALFRHGRIRTTQAKAKNLQPYAEKLITKAKRGDLAARRRVLRELRDRDVVAWLFEEIAPRFAERPGGYTRILKLGPRKGDNAPMAQIELVGEGFAPGQEQIEQTKAERRRGLFGRLRQRLSRGGGPAAEDTAEAGIDEETELDELAAQVTTEGDEQTGRQAGEATEAEESRPAGPAADLDAGDVENVQRPKDAKGPAQSPVPPDQRPDTPVDERDDSADAGDVTD